MTFVRIAKQFTFDAAHFIPTFPEGHKCRNLHGHTYVVELQFVGLTDPATGLCSSESGPGIDYADIAEAFSPVLAQLDHRELNRVPGLEIPTTEVLVLWIARAFYSTWNASKFQHLVDALSTVRVQESSTTWCEVHL